MLMYAAHFLKFGMNVYPGNVPSHSLTFTSHCFPFNSHIALFVLGKRHLGIVNMASSFIEDTCDDKNLHLGSLN